MTEIKTVAIVGASGNIGTVILPQFLETSLKITAISREDSKATFPSSVAVKRTDYSLGSLTEVLNGQDAVICLLGTAGLTHESALVDAAAAAGVKWFIPSEFGHDTTDERIVSLLPLFKSKTKVIDNLRSKESEGLSWTGFITGLLFDFSLGRGSFGFSIKDHTATIWDDGANPFSTANIHTIGVALTHLLTNPTALEQAKNKHLYIQSFATTQNEILAVLEKVTGEKWTIKNVTSKEIVAETQERIKKGDWSTAGRYIQYIALGDGGLSSWKAKAEEGNKLLGIEQESLEEVVRKVVEKVTGASAKV